MSDSVDTSTEAVEWLAKCVTLGTGIAGGRRRIANTLRALAAERDRLREALAAAHRLLDRHMGDTDPADPDDPLLRAAQLLAEALP